MALLESIGDATLTVGLGFVAFASWFNTGEFDEIVRWTQTVIDLADGRCRHGRRLRNGVATVDRDGFPRNCPVVAGPGPDGAKISATPSRWRKNSDPATLAFILAWTYGLEIAYGVLLAEDSALRASEEAMQNCTENRQRQRGDPVRVRVGACSVASRRTRLTGGADWS